MPIETANVVAEAAAATKSLELPAGLNAGGKKELGFSGPQPAPTLKQFSDAEREKILSSTPSSITSTPTNLSGSTSVPITPLSAVAAPTDVPDFSPDHAFADMCAAGYLAERMSLLCASNNFQVAGEAADKLVSIRGGKSHVSIYEALAAKVDSEKPLFGSEKTGFLEGRDEVVPAASEPSLVLPASADVVTQSVPANQILSFGSPITAATAAATPGASVAAVITPASVAPPPSQRK